MDIWNDTAWWVELVFNVCLFILPTIAGIAATGTLGLKTVKWVRLAWKEARAMVDEPSDFVVRLIAARTGRTPEQVSKFIISNLDAVIAVLPDDTPVGAVRD
jgi:hypothetical protein